MDPFTLIIGTISIPELIALISAVAINIFALLVAWLKFKTTVTDVSNEIKNHSDVSIQKLNGMLTYFIHSADRPMWIKAAYEENGKPVFRMLEVNHKYTDMFGLDRQMYIGKTDLEAGWDKVTADEFYHNDLTVWATGEPQNVTETINGKSVRFRKMLLQTPDGNKKGIMGYSVDCADASECPMLDRNNVFNALEKK